jgi:hypothetical protein
LDQTKQRSSRCTPGQAEFRAQASKVQGPGKQE